MNKIPEEIVTTDGISRRRMLKRIGAGAAIAWSAPVLSSIRTPAFAQTPPPPGNCPDDRCGGQCIGFFDPSQGCQTGGCTGGLGCFSGTNTEGGCSFYQNIFCSCISACSSSADCPAGQECLCPDNGCGFSACVSCCGENCIAGSRRGNSRKTVAR